MNAATQQVIDDLHKMTGWAWGISVPGTGDDLAHSEAHGANDLGVELGLRRVAVMGLGSDGEISVSLWDNDQGHLRVEVFREIDDGYGTPDVEMEDALFAPGMSSDAIASFLQALIEDLER